MSEEGVNVIDGSNAPINSRSSSPNGKAPIATFKKFQNGWSAANENLMKFLIHKGYGTKMNAPHCSKKEAVKFTKKNKTSKII